MAGVWMARSTGTNGADFSGGRTANGMLAHGGLRFILGFYLGFAPARIEFGSTSTGKPTLADLRPEHSAVTFNLSHAHGNAMVAIAQGREVGVDLELIREDVEALKLAERFFSDREQQHVRSTAPELRCREFFHYWVAKEAVLKAEGVGLASLRPVNRLVKRIGSGRVPVRQRDVPNRPGSSDPGCGPGWSVRCGAGIRLDDQSLQKGLIAETSV
jgi:hypothetical protein